MALARVALFADGVVGLQVAKQLADAGDPVVQLYLHEPDTRKLGAEIAAACGFPLGQVISARQAHDPKNLQRLRALDPDFIITVYWAHLLKPELFRIPKRGTVNFHPALLPMNRGWYPHVHSLMDGTPTGVTLHAIDETADTGPVWAQAEVPVRSVDTAGSIYARLQAEIVNLFRQSWPLIKSGALAPKPQDHAHAIYHGKKEIDELDLINVDAPTTARAVLNQLRARSFGSRGFAYFVDAGGNRVYVNLRLGPESDFSQPS